MWLERNTRIFNDIMSTTQVVFLTIYVEMSFWTALLPKGDKAMVIARFGQCPICQAIAGPRSIPTLMGWTPLTWTDDNQILFFLLFTRPCLNETFCSFMFTSEGKEGKESSFLVFLSFILFREKRVLF